MLQNLKSIYEFARNLSTDFADSAIFNRVARLQKQAFSGIGGMLPTSFAGSCTYVRTACERVSRALDTLLAGLQIIILKILCCVNFLFSQAMSRYIPTLTCKQCSDIYRRKLASNASIIIGPFRLLDGTAPKPPKTSLFVRSHAPPGGAK